MWNVEGIKNQAEAYQCSGSYLGRALLLQVSRRTWRREVESLGFVCENTRVSAVSRVAGREEGAFEDPGCGRSPGETDNETEPA